MKYSFKSLFNIVSITLVATVLFFASWFIGRAATGSWDIGEWNNKDNYTLPIEETGEQ